MGKIRVAVVDNESSFVSMLKEYFQTSKYVEICYEASDGLEGFKMIQKNQDDMCLYQKISHIEKSYDANIMDLHSAYEALEEEEKKLITSRYYEDKTQQETASLMGMSQVQVSRNEKKILSKMRVTLTTISL